MQCGYIGDRDATLIAYIYDDIDPAERAVFEAHLASCPRCRGEVTDLSGVRQQLAAWNPPAAPALGRSAVDSSPETVSWWRAMPAWAQVAAALLFLGVSASVANLDVRYDTNGVAIHTGWMTRTAPARAAVAADRGASTPAAPAPIAAAMPADGASKADLVALEERLRGEMHSAPASARGAAADADLLRKVRALVDESEKRQQRELALRLAQAMTDVAAQRQADLRKIDTTLTGVQRDLGIQVLQQRERMNYLMRVNQRQ